MKCKCKHDMIYVGQTSERDGFICNIGYCKNCGRLYLNYGLGSVVDWLEPKILYAIRKAKETALEALDRYDQQRHDYREKEFIGDILDNTSDEIWEGEAAGTFTAEPAEDDLNTEDIIPDDKILTDTPIPKDEHGRFAEATSKFAESINKRTPIEEIIYRMKEELSPFQSDKLRDIIKDVLNNE